MSSVQTRLNQIYPEANRGLGTEVVGLKQEIVGESGQTLLLLLGAVGLILLIACANVANLGLARSTARTREFAVRSALGATAAHIRRQLITESVLLALGGGALGLVVASLGMRSLLAAVPGSLPRIENVGVNVPVLLFTFGLTVVVGILFGLAHALKSSNTDVQALLSEGRLGSRGHHRTQGVLVIVQMALALVLLAGASLLFSTIRHLWEVDPGLRTQNLITFKVGLSPSVTETASTTRVAYSQLVERIRGIPGVQAAELSTLVPLSYADNSVPFWLGSQEPESVAEAPRALMSQTGPGYLEAMGIPLLQGRFVTQEDTIETPSVIVIDNVLAETYFPDGDAVDQTITFARAGTMRIIGVVGHVRHWGLGNPSPYTQNQTYMSLYQLPDPWMPLMRPSINDSGSNAA